MSEQFDYSDFTESLYRRILVEANRVYKFEPFGTTCGERHVLWRHDVDFSVHRAAQLAAIEAEEGVLATYFFGLHSAFYSLFERSVADLARRVVNACGHRLGLHFDAAFYDGFPTTDDFIARVLYEAMLLEDLLGAPVEAVSFHNPETVAGTMRADRVGGLLNACGDSVRERYTYVSDSNGYWRFRRLLDVVVDARDERLHVLTHPEWWQAEEMPPRARILRCVEGRAARAMKLYDELLVRFGRENIR